MFHEIHSVFVQFLGELVFGTDGKVDLVFEFLGYLEDSVPPVIGSLGVLDVIYTVIGDNQRILEILPIIRFTMTAETVAVKMNGGKYVYDE